MMETISTVAELEQMLHGEEPDSREEQRQILHRELAFGYRAIDGTLAQASKLEALTTMLTQRGEGPR